MKRSWLYIGVMLAGVLQVLIHVGWNRTFAPHMLSEFAVAAAIGLLYLHVPNAKRAVKSGATLGTILGLLFGIYQTVNQVAFTEPDIVQALFSVLKSGTLGLIGGAVIAWSELKFNPRDASAAKTHSQ